MLDVFEIHEPATVSAAAEMLAHYGFDAAIYAGGTELLLLMKAGLVHYPHLIDIKTVPHLDTITLDTERQALRIGPLVTHHRLEHAPLVHQHAPLLAEVESRIANLRVRAAGTLGGNLCFAEPHSDPATLLLAWGATLELTGPGGTRAVPAAEFFVGLFETIRQPDEILTGITIPLLQAGTGGAYEKFSLHERPTVTVAALLHIQDGVIDDARIALGSVGPMPVRVTAAEDMLRGERPAADLFAAAAEAAHQAADAVDDLYGSAQYKRHLARVLTTRALQAAAQRANGDAHAE